MVSHEGFKIQQRSQNLRAKEGHNSTKYSLNIDHLVGIWLKKAIRIKYNSILYSHYALTKQYT